MERGASADSDVVFLECVRAGGRLRVRILNASYHTDANCQFPRSIREEGRLYSVPASAVKLVARPGSKYYRVDGRQVTVVEDAGRRVEVRRVFTDTEREECVICMAEKKHYVFAPCGHFYVCRACKGSERGVCPICRARILEYVPYTELQ